MSKRSLLTVLAFLGIAMSSIAQVSGTFKDSRDGKIYKTLTIGKQTWMAGNLAFKTSSGCWAYDNSNANAAIYGYLYNWETAKKACPAGWHLPSMAEWKILTDNSGGDKIAGSKLKEAGPKHWSSPNEGATNTSGFTALPGGVRQEDGQFTSINVSGNWWTTDIRTITETSTKKTTIYYGGIVMSGDPDYPLELNSSVDISSNNKEAGLSVRCVKNPDKK